MTPGSLRRLDGAKPRALLSRDPFGDAPCRVVVAVEQLHDGAVDEGAQRQRAILFAFVALFQLTRPAA